MSVPTIYWLNETQGGMYASVVYNVIELTESSVSTLLRRIELFKEMRANDPKLLCMQFEDASATFLSEAFDPSGQPACVTEISDEFTPGRKVLDIGHDPEGGVFFATPWWEDERPADEELRSAMVVVMHQGGPARDGCAVQWNAHDEAISDWLDEAELRRLYYWFAASQHESR